MAKIKVANPVVELDGDDRVRNLERDGLAGLRRVSDQVEAYVAC